MHQISVGWIWGGCWISTILEENNRGLLGPKASEAPFLCEIWGAAEAWGPLKPLTPGTRAEARDRKTHFRRDMPVILVTKGLTSQM